MPLFLSVPAALTQQPEAAEWVQSVRQPWIIPLEDSTGDSRGYRQEVNLRPGLNVLIDDYTLKEELIVETGTGESCEADLALELSFMILGHNRHESVQSGHSFFQAEWCGVDGGRFHWQAGERVLKLDVHIEPVLFETLVGEQLNALPPSLRRLVQNSQPSCIDFWQVCPITAAMQSAIYQILNCPYRGLTQWLFWESKVLELIALRLEQVSQINQAASSGLRPDEIDRIHQASEILQQRLAEPPSLLELARLAGINDHKLKVGFRQVFGTTVFGYLRRHRLEQAHQLLQERQISVSAAAAAVGYSSQGHFAAAFRKQFGFNPKNFP
ncbi:helix-turn-helix transcriptional regulator [Romeria aff. gracilis LEGE 07310]|uniref:Helix-turn-helix transcriptional regulator n=1 Tax=Vasconcelosia minhoensis LEGE 07310 TaxID=915328 RepID=A0A8J7DS96_9CYAN|nr:helix-turn-helix domain-containing protein [Romeria gracilis]MBE9079849.1 helix-turn-helix transcriptional regulator [Romeria aff. gracilis LEGE 07310]